MYVRTVLYINSGATPNRVEEEQEKTPVRESNHLGGDPTTPVAVDVIASPLRCKQAEEEDEAAATPTRELTPTTAASSGATGLLATAASDSQVDEDSTTINSGTADHEEANHNKLFSEEKFKSPSQFRSVDSYEFFNFSRLPLKEYFEIEINQIHKIKSHRCCIINNSGVFQIRKRLPTTVGF